MPASRCPSPLKSSEWQHIAHYVLIALVLHAVVLLYTLSVGIEQIETTRPGAVQVTLTEPNQAIHAVRPATAPTPSPRPNPQREKPAYTAPSILALTSEPTNAPTAFAVAPAPVATNSAGAANIAPAPITAPRFDAAYLHNPLPEYPPISRRIGEEGTVLLKVRVMPDGFPTNIEIEKTSSFERLDNAARHVVARWRFIPAKRGEEAIEASVIVPIVFRLDN